jgi:hypothetical protein
MDAVRGFVANTDYDWFTFLRERQPLEEVISTLRVNAWSTGGNPSPRRSP